MTQEARPILWPGRGLFFDLGDTLYTYQDVPLNWDEHNRPALAAAVLSCDLILNEASIDRAVGVLGEFNTRTNPREIEFKSEYIFMKLLETLNIPEQYLEKIVYQFFSYFRQRLYVYRDAVDWPYANLRRRRIPQAPTGRLCCSLRFDGFIA